MAENVISLQQVADSYANLAARLGAGQDMASHTTYSRGGYLTTNYQLLQNTYRSSWLVGVAIDAVAEDMTREGIDIILPDDPSRANLLEKRMQRRGVWTSLQSLIKWGRLYGGAGAYICIDGQDPSTPLNLSTVGRGQFKGLEVYDRTTLIPDVSSFIPSGKGAGLPVFYNVIAAPGAGGLGNVAAAGRRIHHSRLIRHIGVELPLWEAIGNLMWGQSIIERIFSVIGGYDGATYSAINAMFRSSLRTVYLKKLRDVLAAGGAPRDNLLNHFGYIRQMQNSEGIVLLDAEDRLEVANQSLTGNAETLLQLGQQVSGCTGIPLVRLFGQSPAGFNSTGESDIRLYYDQIKKSQETELGDGMEVLVRVCYMSEFGEQPPEELDFEWRPLWQLTETDKADIASKIIPAVVSAYDSGILSQVQALKALHEAAPSMGVLGTLGPDDIRAAELAPPVPGNAEDPFDGALNPGAVA